MEKFLMFIDDGDDAATFPASQLLGMTCAGDGALIGKVKTISDDGSHTTLVLQDNVTATLADDDEVCYRQPVVFHFGLEY